MSRLLPFSTMAILAAAASAQCYETNLGTLLGPGDDTLFALQPMNITVLMNGGVTPNLYTHIAVNSNGVAFLSNGTAPGGAVNTGYSTSPETMLTTLRGTATDAPRIAPFWLDLDVLAANGGGVWLNNTIAGKCVVTWQNAQAWNLLTSPIFTFQAQIWVDGHIDFYFSGTTQNASTTPMCGVSQGMSVADPGASDLSLPSVGTSTSLILYQSFATANTFTLGGKTVTFTPNAGGGYDHSIVACGASNTSYGTGCGGQFASFYEYLPTSTLASLALTGNSMVLSPVGGNYVASWGGGTYVAPGAGATVLGVGDDGEVTQALSTAFPTPGGPVTDLRVHGNAVITMGSLAQTYPGTNIYRPTSQAFLNAARTAFWSWHDYNSTEVGSGAVKYEEALDGNSDLIAYITWDGVESYPAVANPSTLQFQLTLTGPNVGRVVYVWVSIDGNRTSAYGSAHLVGYSPGGANIDPGSMNLATGLPLITSTADVARLALGVAPIPLIGNTMVYTTSNIPGTAILSAQLISFGQIHPGIDLTGMGAPGCFQRIDLVTAATVMISGSPTASHSLALPNDPSLAGVQLAGQSASLVPGINALNVITSNGVLSVVGTF